MTVLSGIVGEYDNVYYAEQPMCKVVFEHMDGDGDSVCSRFAVKFETAGCVKPDCKFDDCVGFEISGQLEMDNFISCMSEICLNYLEKKYDE